MAERREPQQALGEAVQLIRERKKVSKSNLARRSGFSERWITDVEAGRSNPTWGNIRILASALEVSLKELAEESVRLECKKL